MQHEQEHSLIRRETALPGLGLLLQPDLIRERLRSMSACNDPGELTGGYLRYKPGMNCIARLEFVRNDKPYFAYAKAFGADAAIKFKKACELEQVRGPLGPGRVVLEKEQILFSVFPNDSKLKSLARFQQSGFSERMIDRIFKAGETWESASFRILNYKPERRLVGRLTGQSGQSALVKFFSNTDFDKVRHSRKHTVVPSDVKIPEWIGGSKEHQTVAYSWLTGTTLREQDTQNLAETTRLAGLAIARFHNSEQPRFKKRSRRLETNRIRNLARNLSFLLPGMESSALQFSKPNMRLVAKAATGASANSW